MLGTLFKRESALLILELFGQGRRQLAFGLGELQESFLALEGARCCRETPINAAQAPAAAQTVERGVVRQRF